MTVGVPPSWAGSIASALRKGELAGNRRKRRLLTSATGVRRVVDGRELLCFASNDYLGLAADGRVVSAFQGAANRYGVGAGAAQLLGGYTALHRDLEERIADWLGRERALLFSTGYMANLGLVAGLTARGDVILADKRNHASLLDGALLSRAKLLRYAHGDTAALAERLAQPTGGRRLVVTDTVFSMDGDCAPLASLAPLCAERQVLLAVDEAHALGVIGPQGRGLAAELGLDSATPLLVGTLGKALGAFGAFVAGPQALIEILLQQARPYIYTTALPAAIAAAALAALEIVKTESWRRDKLVSLVGRFRRGAQQLSLDVLDSHTPIQVLVVGSSTAATALSKALEEDGIWVPPIRPPSVPPGGARLRVAFSAGHREGDVDRLLDVLARHDHSS